MHLGGECCAIGTHQSGDIGTHHFDLGEQLEGPQHRVVEEGTPLDDNTVTQLRFIAKLDDLIEGVPHDRVRQARRNIGQPRTLFLRGFHRGVHENCAA